MNECPRLVHVATSLNFNSTPGHNNASRVLLEGLFAHFFSPERKSYHSGNIRWFLELANCQKEWGSGQFEERCGVPAADLSDDNVTQLKQSLMPSITKVRSILYWIHACMFFNSCYQYLWIFRAC